MKHKLLSLLVLVLVSFCAQAKVTVSLVTSCPSDREVYTLWGHTALLVQTDSTCVVYNYGVFEFSDDFIYRFVSGQTDYCLDTDRPDRMVDEILWKNTYGYLQELNLTDSEAEAIADALRENLKPENKYYRYKFFSDNCATRPQHLIERYVQGIEYMPSGNRDSYRDKIHYLCESAPWLRLGIDLCLGSGADEVITDNGMTFLPVSLMACFDAAKVKRGASVRPLVRSKVCICQPRYSKRVDISIVETPLFACCVVLFLSLLAGLLAVFLKKRFFARGYLKGVLFLVAGLVGALIFYLIFFSTHECTSPNFNLMWLNPLHLVSAIILFANCRKRWAEIWLLGDAALVALYLLLIAVLPQSTCAEFVLLSISLIINILVFLCGNGRSFLEFFNKKKLSDKQQIK